MAPPLPNSPHGDIRVDAALAERFGVIANIRVGGAQ
jgi:hypothetical protein